MTVLKSYRTHDFYDEIVVELYVDKILVQEGNYKPRELSFRQILLTHPFSLTNDLAIDFDISLFACKQLKNKPGLGKELQRVIDFYDNYNFELCKTFTYEHVRTSGSCRVSQSLKLTPFGLELWVGNRLKNTVKPDRLFFAGPHTKALPYDIRKQLTDTLFDALGKHTKIHKRDAFPLIDYDRLQKGNYVWERGNVEKGSKLSIENGCIYYGGWSPPNQGGSQTYDMESFVYYGKDFFNLITNRDFEAVYNGFCEIILKHCSN